MTLSDGVAYEALALHLAHLRGELDDDGLATAMSEVVGDVRTQADAFSLVSRVSALSANAVVALAERLDVAPEAILRDAALSCAVRDVSHD